MANSLISDDAMTAASLALNGLSMRQQVISRNLANVDTPGYQAQDIKFEDAVKSAINSSQSSLPMTQTSPMHLTAASSQTSGAQMVQRAGGSERADQNNVDINTELTDMTATGIEYQAISQSISSKLSLLKAISQYH